MQKIVEGVRLAYDDAGSGTVLVLLHGYPFDRTIWQAQFAVLSAKARVIRIDLRGSGESGCGAGPALMETLAGDVFGLLEALDVERAILVGHSMGGYAALAYFRMYAERVSGLALVASHVGADSPQRALERDLQAATIAACGMAGAVEPVIASGFAPAFAASHAGVIDAVRAIVARQDPAGAAAQIIGMKERVDSADLLEDVAVPALIIGGGDDPFIAAATLERTAAAIADCELLLLPGVAHLPMLEASEATTAALERLLARCALSPSTVRHNARADRA